MQQDAVNIAGAYAELSPVAGKAGWPRHARATCVLCVQVALRIRPLSEAEAEEGAALVARRVGEQVSRAGAAGASLPWGAGSQPCGYRTDPTRLWPLWFPRKRSLSNPAKPWPCCGTERGQSFP